MNIDSSFIIALLKIPRFQNSPFRSEIEMEILSNSIDCFRKLSAVHIRPPKHWLCSCCVYGFLGPAFPSCPSLAPNLSQPIRGTSRWGRFGLRHGDGSNSGILLWNAIAIRDHSGQLRDTQSCLGQSCLHIYKTEVLLSRG